MGLADDKAVVPLPPDAEAKVSTMEAPAAKPLTMGLFYALCLATLGLAVWALTSIAL